MSEPALWHPDKIASTILIPLAEAFERLVSESPTLAQYYLRWQLLNGELLKRYYFEVARRYFAFEKSPSYAREFADTVTDTISRFDKLRPPHPLRKPDTAAELDRYTEEYQLFTQSPEYKAWIDSAANAADYLRQLASMIVAASTRAAKVETSRGQRKLTNRQKHIRRAIRRGLKGKDNCIHLEEKGVVPKQKCIDGGCPPT